MFQNVYQRACGATVTGGAWATRALADQMVVPNESPTFRRIAVEEFDDEHPDCGECDGSGTTTYYPGGYGSSSCFGPAEKICPDCNGTGVSDHA